ncbi:D-alanine--D-alanine ligase family protein [Poriferisphaera sp. WC338]|uniref:D-alanine--D-alanine ligase family protein n=1 Tax=Poriferisphaera sp. WC338 TaxID=3425129 RepID=UPI003D8135A6
MNNDHTKLKVMVLAGGPDLEREVSLMSGAEVAKALEMAGHEVMVRDILPGDLRALDDFVAWGGDVIFPAMHGKWGEGGGLQVILENQGLRFVGSRALAARLCMDKQQAKLVMDEAGIATPAFCVVKVGETVAFEEVGLVPGVIKPIDDGSSMDMAICHSAADLDAARERLHETHERLMVERYVKGRELTVSVVLNDADEEEALPVIEIVPAGEFYDYEAKYFRDDTQYLFDLGLSKALVEQIQTVAVRAHKLLGARHLSRVDFMLDECGKSWVLEINTLPGCTTHSLLPMAARQAGIEFSMLVDRLVRAVMTPPAERAGLVGSEV